jgi:hypothetical protein
MNILLDGRCPRMETDEELYDVYKKTSKGNVNFINNMMFPNRHEYICVG